MLFQPHQRARMMTCRSFTVQAKTTDQVRMGSSDPHLRDDHTSNHYRSHPAHQCRLWTAATSGRSRNSVMMSTVSVRVCQPRHGRLRNSLADTPLPRHKCRHKGAGHPGLEEAHSAAVLHKQQRPEAQHRCPAVGDLRARAEPPCSKRSQHCAVSQKACPPHVATVCKDDKDPRPSLLPPPCQTLPALL